MKKYHCDGLLLSDGWIMPAFVETDDHGIITNISDSLSDGTPEEHIEGLVMPGLPNGHSHAFQYAMAGQAETHPTGKVLDDFWSWRETMYSLANKISPEQMEKIGAMVYKEMLRHGYTQVTEFHYLHHDPKGRPYDDKAEMGRRLMAAGERAGIKINLVPVWYQHGGFNKSTSSAQRRFISAKAGDYLKLLERSIEVSRDYKHVSISAGFHSLRAVEADLIPDIANELDPNMPIHIHLAEQQKEVEECIQFLGLRPVEWLLKNIDNLPSWHIVHATHMTAEETEDLASSGANVVLCPSTEGNLGDGLFPLYSFEKNGGSWCIGTDSHIGLSPWEELRLLDYGQRLRHHLRAILNRQDHGDMGSRLLNSAIMNGRKTYGLKPKDYFEVGAPFDAIILDKGHPLLQTAPIDRLTATIVYCCDNSMLIGTLVNGEWIVRDGRHPREEKIHSSYVEVVDEIRRRT